MAGALKYEALPDDYQPPMVPASPKDDAAPVKKRAGSRTGVGMVEPGNIDLEHRPVVKNKDGSISTVASMSFDLGDGKETLIPMVKDDGSGVFDNTPEGTKAAIEQYRKTGKHLGKFDNPDHATAYAKQLHEDQAAFYDKPSAPKLEAMPDDYNGPKLESLPDDYVPPPMGFAEKASRLGETMGEKGINPLIAHHRQADPLENYVNRYSLADAQDLGNDETGREKISKLSTLGLAGRLIAAGLSPTEFFTGTSIKTPQELKANATGLQVLFDSSPEARKKAEDTLFARVNGIARTKAEYDQEQQTRGRTAGGIAADILHSAEGNVAYTLQFLAGGPELKAVKTLGWAGKALFGAKLAKQAAPTIIPDAITRFKELTTDDAALDENGKLMVSQKGADALEAGAKAIGGSILGYAIEKGITPYLAKGAGALINKVTGGYAGKAVEAIGERAAGLVPSKIRAAAKGLSTVVAKAKARLPKLNQAIETFNHAVGFHDMGEEILVEEGADQFTDALFNLSNQYQSAGVQNLPKAAKDFAMQLPEMAASMYLFRGGQYAASVPMNALERRQREQSIRDRMAGMPEAAQGFIRESPDLALDMTLLRSGAYPMTPATYLAANTNQHRAIKKGLRGYGLSNSEIDRMTPDQRADRLHALFEESMDVDSAKAFQAATLQAAKGFGTPPPLPNAGDEHAPTDMLTGEKLETPAGLQPQGNTDAQQEENIPLNPPSKGDLKNGPDGPNGPNAPNAQVPRDYSEMDADELRAELDAAGIPYEKKQQNRRSYLRGLLEQEGDGSQGSGVRSQENVQDGKDDLSKIGGMAQGMRDGFVSSMWDRLEQGKKLIGSAPLEDAVTEAHKRGEIKSAEELKVFIDDFYKQKGGVLSGQKTEDKSQAEGQQGRDAALLEEGSPGQSAKPQPSAPVVEQSAPSAAAQAGSEAEKAQPAAAEEKPEPETAPAQAEAPKAWQRRKGDANWTNENIDRQVAAAKKAGQTPYVTIRREMGGGRIHYEAYDTEGKKIAESAQTSGRGSIAGKLNARKGSYSSAYTGEITLKQGEPFTWDGYRERMRALDEELHPMVVQQAIEDGKDVPPEVKADFEEKKDIPVNPPSKGDLEEAGQEPRPPQKPKAASEATAKVNKLVTNRFQNAIKRMHAAAEGSPERAQASAAVEAARGTLKARGLDDAAIQVLEDAAAPAPANTTTMNDSGVTFKKARIVLTREGVKTVPVEEESSQKSEIRSQEAEVGGKESEVRSQEAPDKALPPLKAVGAKQKVVGREGTIVDTQRVDNIDYELYRTEDGGGVVRSFDHDGGEMVDGTHFRDFNKAIAHYNKTVKSVDGKQYEAPVEDATPAKTAPESDIKAAEPESVPAKDGTIGVEEKGNEPGDTTVPEPVLGHGDRESGKRVAGEAGIPVESGDAQAVPDKPARTGKRSAVRSAAAAGVESDNGDGTDSAPTDIRAESGAAAGGDTEDVESGGQTAAEEVSKPNRSGSRERNTRNHVIRPDDEIAPAGQISKIRANIRAIETLKKIEAENRAATPEEQQVLAKYTGWGHSGELFNETKGRAYVARKENSWAYGYDENWAKKFGEHYDKLKSLLSEEEWNQASASILFAHYTSKAVVTKLWDLARHLGFRGGKVMEPAAGIGNFFGLMPKDLSAKSDLIGVELEPMSGRMLKALYPDATIFVDAFQNVKTPPNTLDLAITNVPFNKTLTIPDARYPKLNLHNYFIARMIDAVKPGGIAIAISSYYTMDANKPHREFLSSKADLIGAIRLPNTAFKANAGTEVVTDVLIFRKPDGPARVGEPWVNMGNLTSPEAGKGQSPSSAKSRGIGDSPISVNEYFVAHPDMMLGTPSLEGSMYGGEDEFTLNPKPGDLGQQIQEAIDKLPRDIAGKQEAVHFDFSELGTAKGFAENSIQVIDGRVTVVQDGKFVDPGEYDAALKSAAVQARMVAYTEVRKAYEDYNRLMRDDGATDKAINDARLALNRLYDQYVKKHGYLGDSRKTGMFSFDPRYYFVTALEEERVVLNPKTQKKERVTEKAKVLHERTIWPVAEPKSADSPYDAMLLSMAYKGKIDSDYIASLTGVTSDEALRALQAEGRIFLNPETGLYEEADRYLSGNVREKLEKARAYAETDPAYKANVAALEAVQPGDIAIEDITFRIGATWVPADVIERFAKAEIGGNGSIRYSQPTNRWLMEWNDYGLKADYDVVADQYKWFNGSALLDHALNLKRPMARRSVRNSDGSTTTISSESGTVAARERIDKLQRQFREWVLKDRKLAEELGAIYNKSHNNVVNRDISGDHLTMPGMSSEVELRSNQKRAIWRMIQDQAGLLAHAVGAGKTYEMIGIAMESRRLGTAKKPLLVCQNATVGQVATSFMKMYPSANILVPSKKDFETKRRKKLLSRIASGDFDSIIMAQSQFDMLANDPAREQAYIEERIQSLREALAEESEGRMRRGGKSLLQKDIEKRIRGLEAKLEGMKEKATKRADTGLTFEELGVDLMIIDEAHAYKKPPFDTKLQNLIGLNLQFSARGYNLMLKTMHVQEKRNGRGAIGATGTPITNTLGEAYHMIRLFSPNLLKDFGVEQFDDFVSSFTEITAIPTQNAAGKWVLKDGIKRFVNGPELVKMIRASWDIITSDQLRDILQKQHVQLGKKGTALPVVRGGGTESVAIPLSDQMADFIEHLRAVYAKFKELPGKQRREFSYIPLLSFMAARAGALDIRLVNPRATDDPGSKVNAVVRNVVETYKASQKDRATQLIFSDTSNRFDMSILDRFLQRRPADSNIMMVDDEGETAEPAEAVDTKEETSFLYQDIKQKLIAAGIPANEIAFANEPKTDAQKAALWEKVNEGEVRVLIGSTAKMGVGVNVQKRLIALHHLDTPFLPADIEQREGRIIRSGNIHPEVSIRSYGMIGTLDAANFAMLLRKVKGIRQVLSGEGIGREFEDPATADVLSYEQQMAVLSGNPLVFEKIEVDQRVRELAMLKEQHGNDQRRHVGEAEQLDRRVKYFTEDNIPALERTAEKLKGVDWETVSATIDGKKHGTPADVAKAIDAVIEANKGTKVRDAAMAGRESALQSDYQAVFRLGPITTRVASGIVAGEEAPRTRTYFELNKTLWASGAQTGTGILKAAARGDEIVETELNHRKAEVTAAEKRAAELRALAEKPFEQEDEYAKAVSRQAEIDKALTGTEAPAASKEDAEEEPPAPQEAFSVTRDVVRREAPEFTRWAADARTAQMTTGQVATALQQTDIARAIPGAHIHRNGEDWEVTAPNGETVLIRTVSSIPTTDSREERMRKDYGASFSRQSGKQIDAMYQGVSLRDAQGRKIDAADLIFLSQVRGEKTIKVRHELVHWAKKLGLWEPYEWRGLINRAKSLRWNEIARRIAPGQKGLSLKQRTTVMEIWNELSDEEKVAHYLQENSGIWARIARYFRRVFALMTGKYELAAGLKGESEFRSGRLFERAPREAGTGESRFAVGDKPNFGDQASAEIEMPASSGKVVNREGDSVHATRPTGTISVARLEDIERFSITIPPDVRDRMEEARAAVADFWQDRGDIVRYFREGLSKRPTGKRADIGFFDPLVATMAWYAEKVPALKKMYDAAQNNADVRNALIDTLFGDMDGGVNDASAWIRELRTRFPEAKAALDTYLFERDRDALGYQVKERGKDVWAVMSLPKSNGERQELERFNNENEAWSWAYQHEADEFAAAMRLPGHNPEAVAAASRALLGHRLINHRKHAMLTSRALELKQEYEKVGGTMPEVVLIPYSDGSKDERDLWQALREMGDRRGYYMPRLRGSGRYVLFAQRQTATGVEKLRKHFDTEIARDAYHTQLRRKGWKTEEIQYAISDRPSEDAFLEGSIAAMNDLTQRALDTANKAARDEITFESMGMKAGLHTYKRKDGKTERHLIISAPDTPEINAAMMEFGGQRYDDGQTGTGKAWHWIGAPRNLEKKILERFVDVQMTSHQLDLVRHALFANLAAVLHSRGSRQSKIGRNDATGQDVWTGYETDAERATMQQAFAIAGGSAKGIMAKNMLNAFMGKDTGWDEYKAENLPEDWDKLDDDDRRDEMHDLWNKYNTLVRANRVDSAKQPRAFSDGLSFMREMLRNETAAERMFGLIKGATAAYFLSRPSSAVVNLTALPTVVVPAMKAFGDISLKRAPVLLTRASRKYTEHWLERKGLGFGRGRGQSSNSANRRGIGDSPSDLTKEDRALFDEIRRRRWDDSQYRKETVGALQHVVGRGWSTALDTALTLFSVTESLNRGATIAATYWGIKEQYLAGKGQSSNSANSRGIGDSPEWTQAKHEAALQLAHEVSEKAHGNYTKANLPSWARGDSPGALVARSMYLFQNYTHNYLQLLPATFKRDKAAAAWMLASPMIMGGVTAGGGGLLTVGVVKAVGEVFRAIGVPVPDDIFGSFFEWLEKNIGWPVARFARQGLMGLVGVDIRGSTEIRLNGALDFFWGAPFSIWDLAGAAGGVVKRVGQGVTTAMSGDPLKGIEEAAPPVLASPFRAVREYARGVSTGKGKPVYDASGAPVHPGVYATLLRALSFNPAEVSEATEKQYSRNELKAQYAGLRSAVYDRVKAYVTSNHVPATARSLKAVAAYDPEAWADIQVDVNGYNERVKRQGLHESDASFITNDSIQGVIRDLLRPPKKDSGKGRTVPRVSMGLAGR